MSTFSSAPFSSEPRTTRSAQALTTLEQSFTELLDVVLVERRAGRVSSLVVDDTSGRAIGLFLHRGMALLGEKTPIIFVCPPRPGARGEREAAILTPRQTELLGGTPLIVTEIIYSGEAVGSIVRALNRVGRVPDIASMSGFLTASEPYRPVLETSPVGRRPRGEFGKIVMSSSLSYAAQDLLTTDKVYAGVIREDISSTRVRPVRSMTDNPEVALEVNAFRGEIYRLAARLAALRASD